MHTLHIPLPGGIDLAATFASGQAFRWHEQAGIYYGVAGGYTAQAQCTQDTLTLYTDGSEAFWRHYFAADIDYAALRGTFCEDATLASCVRFASGIRVLRQPFFETLCTFIISQNNNIPRITGIVERLCEAFGTPLASGGYAFPTPDALANKTVQDLAPLRAGFRAKYLLDAAQKAADGTISETALAHLSTQDARAQLCSIYGVGQKVADCALLFALGRNEVVPIDVHMRRAMTDLFPSGLPDSALPFAGIAQQYIFHYTRLCAKATQA